MENSKAERDRLSSRKKMDMALRGDDLYLVLQEAGVTHAGLHRTQDFGCGRG